MTYTIDDNDVDELEHLIETVLYLELVIKMDRKEKFIFESVAFRLGAILDRIERDQLLKEKEQLTDEDYLAALGPCGK